MGLDAEHGQLVAAGAEAPRATVERWTALCEALALAPVPDTGRAVLQCWSRAGRAWHGLGHLEECLAELDACRGDCADPHEVELALWFHDAVYRSWSRRNEAASAEWARRTVLQAGGDAGRAERIAAHVLATRHETNATGDAAWVVDIDLAALGRLPAEYERYEQAIRAEYWWVPRPRWRRARAAVIKRLLARPQLYSTERFRARLERPARENLRRELLRLALTPA